MKSELLRRCREIEERRRLQKLYMPQESSYENIFKLKCIEVMPLRVEKYFIKIARIDFVY